MGAGDSIREYNKTAASNTSIGGINLSEGVMVPSDLNNSHRELMSHLAAMSDGTDGIDVLSLVDDDASAAIKLQAPAEVTTTTTFTLPDGDGSDGQVLQTDGSGALSWAVSFSAGMLMPYAGTSAPTGWLLAYGQTIGNASSGATEADDNYQALFDIVKVAYGNSGSEVFADGDTVTLPDLRGRTIAGQDDMGGSSANRLTSPINGDTLGAAGGSQSHTLSTAQLPSHEHYVFQNSSFNGGSFSSFNSTDSLRGGVPNDTPDNWQYVFKAGSSAANRGLSSSTGSGSSHNNVQPTIILNYIIKT